MSVITNHMGRPKRSFIRKDGFTPGKRKLFLDVLAATGHVGHAAASAGIAAASARRLRARDPQFAALWRDALEQGYQRLEEELLAYALGDKASPANPGPERDEPPAEHVRPFDPELALKILQVRGRKRASRSVRSVPPVDPAEVDAALLKKLEGLSERLARQ